MLLELKSFYYFIIHPHKAQLHFGRSKLKTNCLLKLKIITFSFVAHIIGMILGLGLVMVMNFLMNYFGLPKSTPLQENISLPAIGTYKTVLSTLVIIFIAPIVEEIAFRYPLIPERYSLPIAILAYILMVFFFTKVALFNLFSNNYLDWFSAKKDILYFLGGIFVVITGLLYTLSKEILVALHKLWNRYIWVIIILISLYFALLHSSLPLNTVNAPWIIAMTFPHFISGLTYSYIRIKYGITLTILCHVLWNTIIFSPSIIFN